MESESTDTEQKNSSRSEPWPQLEDYETDVTVRSLLSRDDLKTRHLLGILGIGVLAAFPALLTPLQLAPLVGVVFLMIFAVSWDIVSGYTGQLSFGHAYFFALGGYTTTVLNLQHGISPLVSIPIAVLVAGLGGLIIGIPALRLRGPYLSLVTLIVPVIMLQVFTLLSDEFILNVGPVSIPIAPGGFGGTIGLSAPDALISTSDSAVVTVSSFSLEVLANYYLALLLLIGVTCLLLILTKTNTGDIFTAIREDEDALTACGINPAKFKIFAFVLSGVIGGFAAAIFVHTFAGVAQPAEILSIELSINVIIYSVLGGMGTIIGPILGVVFFEGAIQILEGFDVTVFGAPVDDLAPILLYVASIGVLMRRPEGLYPALLRSSQRWKDRLRGESPTEKPPKETTTLWRTVENFLEELKDIANKKR